LDISSQSDKLMDLFSIGHSCSVRESACCQTVEAAVEADHQRHAAFPDDCNARLGTAVVEVERLFTAKSC
jgi:hypothetical protein